jgi:aldehyde:ferredoxin oxidoreductase
LFEEKIITTADVGGAPLTRDIDTVITWCEKTAFREGFGDILADGWYGLIQHFGEDFASRIDLIKGRQGVWDPRIAGLGTNEFAQLVYPRGPNAECGGSGLYTLNQPIDQVKKHADRMGFSKEQIDRAFSSSLEVNIGRLTVSSEHWLALFNSLGTCNRHVNNRFYSINIIADLYSSLTGIEVSPQVLMSGAERVWNLLKILNVREGFTRKNDEPPDKWFEPIYTLDGKELRMMDYYGNKILTKGDVDQWLSDYYDERGWISETGVPSKEKLSELGIDDLEVRVPESVSMEAGGES